MPNGTYAYTGTIKSPSWASFSWAYEGSRPYLFVGGRADKLVHYIQGGIKEYNIPYTEYLPPVNRNNLFGNFTFKMQRYTRRKFTNPSGYSFTVFAPENMKGHEVLIQLGKGGYENNPLYPKEEVK